MAEIYHGSTKTMPVRVRFPYAISHTWFNKRKPTREGGRRKEEKGKGNEQEFATALSATGGQAEASSVGVG